MDKDIFQFNLPIDVIKADGGSKDTTEWRIGGYASTSDEDRQGDTIVQKGLDISDFVNYGYFNLNHKDDVVLGYPDKNKCKVDSHGFYCEGVLLKGVEAAKNMWETAVALKKSNAPRRLGFSVEGKVLSRDDSGKIVKAKVYNVALTMSPVNPNATWDALVKSFATGEECPCDTSKTVQAGYSTNIGDINNGGVLKKESLESALRILAKAGSGDADAYKLLQELGPMTAEDAVMYFQVSRGLSKEDATKLVQRIYEGGN